MSLAGTSEKPISTARSPGAEKRARGFRSLRWTRQSGTPAPSERTASGCWRPWSVSRGSGRRCRASTRRGRRGWHKAPQTNSSSKQYQIRLTHLLRHALRRASAACRRGGWPRRPSPPSAGSPWHGRSGCRRDRRRRPACPSAVPSRAPPARPEEPAWHPGILAERAGELGRFAHVDDLHLREVLFEPVRLDFPDAAEGEAQRCPAGLDRWRGLVAGLAATQVGRHRLVDLLRMRQVEVLHVADIVAFADLAAQPGIEPLLLGDAADRETAIVVRGIEQAALGQRKDARTDRAIERPRIALLEVGAAGAADQQAVGR